MHDGVAVGSAIGAHGVGDALFIGLAGPPCSAHGDIDDVVVRSAAFPAIVVVHEHVFVVVSVSGEGDAVFAGFEDAEQSFAAGFDPGSGFDEWYVHHGDDESILGHMFEVIFDESELFFAESGAVEFFLSVAHPVDVVDGDEVHGAVVE